MRSTAPLAVDPYDAHPPEHWILPDGFNMPVTSQTNRREDTLQQTFKARIAREGLDASVHGNVALRWDKDHPTVGVDPDILWVEPSLPADARSVLTWVKGVSPPRIAVEVVGLDTAYKDYNQGPEKYALSGTRELWVFDPDGYGRTEEGRGPWKLRVWRRVKRTFRCMYEGDGPAFSRELGAWLVVVGDELRVANDRKGQDLWPTLAEETQRERERAEKERERAEKERERADDEARARADAEARIRTLEAKVRALEARFAPTAPVKPRAKKRSPSR